MTMERSVCSADFRAWYNAVDYVALAAWVKSRPKVVRNLLVEFPFGTRVEIESMRYIVFGATESGHLILVPEDATDYDSAVAARRRLCPEHLRNGEVLEIKEAQK